MAGHARQRFVKRCFSVIATTLAKAQRAGRVPGRGETLARVHLPLIIVRIQGDGFARRRDRVTAVTSPMQHEGERAPGVGRRGIEPAALTRMTICLLQGGHVRRGVRSRRFERKHAGGRHADMRRRIVGRSVQRFSKHPARPNHCVTIERLERRTSVDERTIGCGQRVDCHIRLERLPTFNGRDEPVALPRQSFDTRRKKPCRTAQQPGERPRKPSATPQQSEG